LKNLKDRDLRREGILVAEGRFLTERFLASGWQVSLLACLPHLEQEITALAEAYAAGGQAPCPVEVLTREKMEDLAGFPFHRGVLAAGPRPEFSTLPEFLTRQPDASRIVICPDLSDAENLGSIIRSAAAFGWDAVVTGSRCTDPLSRRVLKVSMGGVFSLPLIEAGGKSTAGISAADELKAAGFTLAGSAAPGAHTDYHDNSSGQPFPLEDFTRPRKIALVLGGEAYGLAPPWASRCDSFITIPMAAAVDSLNVGVAAAIIMHRLQK
ncbi:MAG: RNA methyltransferase, partial [Spirochaetales bacterium]